jgi:hypothetical protein
MPLRAPGPLATTPPAPPPPHPPPPPPPPAHRSISALNSATLRRHLLASLLLFSVANRSAAWGGVMGGRG